jgi:hypothetical protein
MNKTIDYQNIELTEQLLFDSVKNEDAELVKYLLENNCPWDKKRGVVQMNAIFINNFEILKLLVIHGCELHSTVIN